MTKSLIRCIFLGILAVLMFLAAAIMLSGCKVQAVADEGQLPPSPLDTITYRGMDVFETVTKVYDATTGHTWWVLEYVDRDGNSNTWGQHQFVVLDTAGTESHG